MSEILIVTSNRNKAREFLQGLEGIRGVRVEAMEYPELRSDDPREIVALASKMLAEKLNKAVVVEDSGLFITALKGFPGTCTKYVFERIGNKGLLKLMKGKRNRQCFYVSAIGYCEPGKKPATFMGREEGRIAQKERGAKGWGQDPIFIPKGKRKTYGETRTGEDINLFRKRAISRLRRFLLEKR